MNIQLVKLAHARSGDKGDTANVGLIALRDEIYPILVREAYSCLNTHSYSKGEKNEKSPSYS